MPLSSLGHRAPLLWLVLPFIGGLCAGRAADLDSTAGVLAVGAAAAGAACWAAWRAPRFWPAAIVVALGCAGAASGALHRARLPSWDALPAREARLTLRVDRVFSLADPRRATGLATLVAADEHLRDLTGQRIYFSLALRRGEAVPIRSTVVSAVGVLLTLPRNPPADTFDGYLASSGINFRLTRGRVLAVTRPPSGYYRFCARAAERCSEILGLGIAEKRPALTALLRGTMLGAKHELSDEQQTLFMQSGTMHLFAISGLNIGVIASALQALMLLLRWPPWLRFLVGSALLWLFVDITGAAPSAVRAFVMAAFLQAAFVLQRPANILAGLVASAFVVLLVSPLQVFSASFLMSYTIVLALLVLGLPLGEAWIERWSPWRRLPKPAWSWWQRAVEWAWRTFALALAIGVATTLVSLLTGVQFFRLLTPGALIANLVLIPAAVVVTLGGFAALLCGLVGFVGGAALCNHGAALMLLIIEELVRLSVRLPGAYLPAHYTAAWIGSAALAALMATLVFGYAAHWKRERGGWWPPFAVVALTLAFGVKFG